MWPQLMIAHAIMQSSSTITPGVGVTPTFADLKGRSLREQLLQGAAGSTSRHLLDSPVNTQVGSDLGESCASCMDSRPPVSFCAIAHVASWEAEVTACTQTWCSWTDV